MEMAHGDQPAAATDQASTVEGRVVRPDLLVVGGTGRNSGKTELACRLIARNAPSIPVVGLKVTTVDRNDGHCPHGGGGCGVCSSLESPWVISRELDRSPAKDSCRLLASGAHRVYWLRVLRSMLAEGAADLLTRVPPGWVGVAESTSLVSVVEPGLFLLVRSAESTRTKPSARAVAHLADGVVASNGRSFDLDLDRVSVVDGQWALRREACAIVVGGAEVRHDADGDTALRRTLVSLESQFDRVAPWSGTAHPNALRGLPDAWFLVAPPVAEGIPPSLVNAMFRRQAGVDAVVAATRPDGRGVGVVLCRRKLLAEAVAAVAGGAGAAAALGDRCAVRRLELEAWRSGAGAERLPEAAHRGGAASPAFRRGAEAP